MYTVVDDNDIILFVKGPDQVIWLEKINETTYQAKALHFDLAEDYFKTIDRSDLAEIVLDYLNSPKEKTIGLN